MIVNHLVKKITLSMLKLISGFIVAYILAIIGQFFIGYKNFSFIFVLFSVTTSFYYLIKDYSFLKTVLLDIFLISFIFFLKLYIMVAYGS